MDSPEIKVKLDSWEYDRCAGDRPNPELLMFAEIIRAQQAQIDELQACINRIAGCRQEPDA